MIKLTCKKVITGKPNPKVISSPSGNKTGLDRERMKKGGRLKYYFFVCLFVCSILIFKYEPVLLQYTKELINSNQIWGVKLGFTWE